MSFKAEMGALFNHSARDGFELPGVTVQDNVTDGTRTITVSVWVNDLDGVDSAGPTVFRGLRLESRDAANYDQATDGAGLQVDLTYGPTKDPDSGGDGGEIWSFDTGWREEKIENHPKIEDLIKNYGGIVDPGTGKVTFPEKLPEGAGSNLRLGLSKTADDKDAVNPMFGQETFLWFTCIARRQYNTNDLSTAFEGMDEIFEQLPGEGPKISFGDGRNWLKMAPKPSEQADGTWNVVEEYMLSKRKGWSGAIHDLRRGL